MNMLDMIITNVAAEIKINITEVSFYARKLTLSLSQYR